MEEIKIFFFVGTAACFVLAAGMIFFFLKAMAAARERDIAYYALVENERTVQKLAHVQIAEITMRLQGSHPGKYSPKFSEISRTVKKTVEKGFARIDESKKV